MSACRVCSARVEPFISFGRMPLANGFLCREDFSKEYFFELKAAFCERCQMTQLAESVPREKLFHDHYPFFTSSSQAMSRHFQNWAARSIARLRTTTDPFIVEIGSNDGTLLEPFAAAGLRHLGVEPSENVAQAARRKGVQSVSRFFDEEAARDIVRDHGQADLILAANCFCHISDLNSLAKSVRILLKPKGTLVFEDPYIADIVKNTAYDQIYDEHAVYFSVVSVANWLARHELEIVDVEPRPVHGGSMRYTVAHLGALTPAPAVEAQKQEEERLGLHKPETYEVLRSRIERSRDDLTALVTRLKKEGRRIAGYAATSKSTTVLNYCGLTAEQIDFISDTTPLKQGRFSPGTHIPIRPREEFQARFPDYALLLAWNHAEEILGKEEDFRLSGGQWIVHVPSVRLLS